jgi:hypothetical protein
MRSRPPRSGSEIKTLAWLYPPPALLLATPLALLPYPVALAPWLLLPLIGLALLLRRLAPHPLTPWLVRSSAAFLCASASARTACC